MVKVNQAEAEFWRKSEGYRVGWSDEILGFDCGGEQWVSETCFPAGTLSKPSMKDLEYIEELMQLINKELIPAPAPIEQRWTARSKSPMSPASSKSEDDIFSWVIAMQLFHCFRFILKLAFLSQYLKSLASMQNIKYACSPSSFYFPAFNMSHFQCHHRICSCACTHFGMTLLTVLDVHLSLSRLVVCNDQAQ